MSKKRISDKAGRADFRTLPRGPNGRALCRWCRREVPKRRRTFCSRVCVHQHKLRTQPAYVRTCLDRRDHGVCAACGLDVPAEAKRLEEKRGTVPHAEWVAEFKAKLGLPPGSRNYRRYWDADHVKPVAEDGGECGIDNYQTLCLACHKVKTEEQRVRAVKQAQHTKQENDMSEEKPDAKTMQKRLKAWMADEDNKASRIIGASKLMEMAKAMDPDIRGVKGVHTTLVREVAKAVKKAMLRCYDNKRTTLRPTDIA